MTELEIQAAHYCRHILRRTLGNDYTAEQSKVLVSAMVGIITEMMAEKYPGKDPTDIIMRNSFHNGD